MLFNSHIFIFIFLPITVLLYYFLRQTVFKKHTLLWLTLASLFFYGWWAPKYLLLILGSIIFNYWIGTKLLSSKGDQQRKMILAAGVVVDLLLLGYFKYTNFSIDLLNSIFHWDMTFTNIVLPLAISFFTFQQIAYIVDCYRHQIHEHKFVNYCLFVTFFPQLIAGPIVHHNEMLPQLLDEKKSKAISRNLALGFTIFAIGLFKKVIIADSAAQWANGVFSGAEQGVQMTFFEAWFGTLSYSLQIYFDFSGYSDMATGLGWLFGLRLPVNFFSPYQACNITEFWRRWHVTLSSFLRDYLYVPLGGSRKGPLRLGINLMITMLLGGLWHGASLTFVMWGALHGVYLIVHNLWQKILKYPGGRKIPDNMLTACLSVGVTFLAVNIGWVFFKCQSMITAIQMLRGLLGLNGFVLWDNNRLMFNKLFGLGDRLALMGVQFQEPKYFLGFKHVSILFVILLGVWFLPNTYELMKEQDPNTNVTRLQGRKRRMKIVWKPNVLWALFYAVVFLGTVLSMSKASEFIYFQF